MTPSLTSNMQRLSSSLSPASTRHAVIWQTQSGRQCPSMPTHTVLPNGHCKNRTLLQLQASTVDSSPTAETVEAERPVAMVSNVS